MRKESKDEAWFLGSSRTPTQGGSLARPRVACNLVPMGVGSVPSTELWPGHPEELRLDFGSTVPLRTRVNRQLILTNCSPIQTPFTLKFEYFGSPQNSLSQKPSL